MSTSERQAIQDASEVRERILAVPSHYGSAIRARLEHYGVGVLATGSQPGQARFWIRASALVVRVAVARVPYSLVNA